MEENTPRSSSFLEMNLDYDGGNVLLETVRWSKFLSVVGIVGLSLFTVIMVFALPTIITQYAPLLPEISGMPVIIVLFFLLFTGVLVLLVIMLYRFSVLTRRGIELQDQDMFNRGLKGLKIYFLVTGIFSLISVAVSIFSLTNLF